MAVTAVPPNISVNGDSSPSTLAAESSFRELDHAFLQTQARIWLGEVLQIRLDEEANISDILADGEILCEVAELLYRVLPASTADASHIRAHEPRTFGSSKSTMRYTPYFNVGTFLQLCKDLGLNDIDLFSPSDVVEKRDTRKVCICIRAFSKKVRSIQINVPDFDSVVCTIAIMPTDKVEGIRKSLEQSQCSSSLTTPNNSVKFRMKMPNQPSHYCDEAESRPIEFEPNQPSDHPCLELIGDDHSLPELQVNTADLENEDHRLSEYLSPSVPESVGSLSSVCFSDQELSAGTSSNFQASLFGGMNHKTRNERQNGDINHVPFYWGEFPSDDDYQDHTAYIDEADQDHTAYIDEAGVLSHDNGNSDTASSESCPLTTRSCPDIGCETRWKNLISTGERDSFVYDECFDETTPWSVNESVHSDGIKHDINPCEANDSNYGPQVSNEATNASNEAFDIKMLTSDPNEERSDSNHGPQASNEATNASDEAIYASMLTSDPKEECNDENAMGVDARHSTNLPEMDLNCSDTSMTSGKGERSDEGSQNTPEVCDDHNIEGENIDDEPVNVEDVLSVNSSSTTLDSPEPEVRRVEDVEETIHKHHQFAGDTEKDVSHDKGTDQETPQPKSRMTVLKTVAKGTALVGASALLLHLRWKNYNGIKPKVKKEPNKVPKKRTQEVSSQETEKVGSSSSVYPAHRLHFW